jgi:hypothetical protein
MANEGAQPGDGATGGDQSKDGSGKSSGEDKDFVPKSQFLAALKSANEKNHALEVQIAELRGKQSTAAHKVDDEPKRYSRAELSTAVEAKTITADQAEEIWAKQIREDVKREVKAEVLGVAEANRKLERVETDLNEYKRLAPEIMEEGSETRQKVREEFEYLVGLGNPGAADDPKTLQTQLLAIRNALGPLDKLRTAKSARRETEAHEETGGSSGSGSRRRSEPKTAWEALDKRQKEYYEGAISKGLYKDKAAVEAELKFSRKAGARA